MGDGFQFLDIIFFAMVAAFIVLRLRSVLGRRTGSERHRPDRFRLDQTQSEDNVVALPDRPGPSPSEPSSKEDARLWADDSPIGAGLTQIKIADHAFEPARFINGARAAYEMVVAAFANGDRETLKMLVNDDVYQNFAGAIQQREDGEQTLETTIVAIETADIVEAELKGKIAEITVKFVSEMVSVLKDKDGEPVGSPGSHQREVTDIWTFSRDVSGRDPNWLLVATRSEN